VQLDGGESAKVYALDAATGRTVWEAARDAVSWASPICVDTGPRAELVLVSSQSAASYEPRTGRLLWKHDCMGGEVAPSAAYAQGMVVVAQQSAKAVGIRLGGAAAESAQIAWQWDEALPDVASPVASGELLFMVTSSGTAVCLDLKAGTKIWDHDFDNGFYASPIVAGERLYALDREGLMRVMKVGNEFAELARSPLGEKTCATPAFLDGALLIRGEKNLFCIGVPKKQGAGS
jgi:outer membrane protein assembly factor BamB